MAWAGGLLALDPAQTSARGVLLVAYAPAVSSSSVWRAEVWISREATDDFRCTAH